MLCLQAVVLMKRRKYENDIGIFQIPIHYLILQASEIDVKPCFTSLLHVF